MAFGKPSITAIQLLETIKKMQVFDRVPTTRGQFVHDVTSFGSTARKRVIAELGRVLEDEGYKQLPRMETLHAKHPKEFLCDVVWKDRSSGVITLVAESEVGHSNKHVLEDFIKLFSVKSPLKLMLFCVRGEPRDVIKLLEKELNSYGWLIPGEEYALVHFCHFTTGCLEAYRFVVGADNRPTKLTKFYVHPWTDRNL